MADITPILNALSDGDPQAAEQLLPLVYDALRRLAAEQMAQERPGQTLQATALVHEAYLRLVDGKEARHWNGRGHFFAAAAEAMRHLLVDRARRKRSRKRGGDRARVPFDEANLAAAEDAEELDRLNLALAADLRATGRAFLSSTRLRGRVALRFCFVNWRTTAADVEEVVQLLARLGAAALSRG